MPKWMEHAGDILIGLLLIAAFALAIFLAEC